MLDAMNRIGVAAGDVFYLPTGVPHAIGPGILLTELQEPTSFSVLAEYAQFGLDESEATLGLGWERALECFDYTVYDANALGDLKPAPSPVDRQHGGQVEALFPPAAAEFFQAHRAQASGRLPLGAPGFRVFVFERGSGTLDWDGGAASVRAGETWVVPHGAGPLTLDGEIDALVCLPPEVGS